MRPWTCVLVSSLAIGCASKSELDGAKAAAALSEAREKEAQGKVAAFSARIAQLEKEVSELRETDTQYFATANEMQKKGDLAGAIAKFEALQERFPGSALAPQAELKARELKISMAKRSAEIAKVVQQIDPKVSKTRDRAKALAYLEEIDAKFPEQAVREATDRARQEVNTRPCYSIDNWTLSVACPTQDEAEEAFFAGLTKFHTKTNMWGGKPEIEKVDRLVTSDAMKVKFKVIQRDRFGEERGQGSEWTLGQTFTFEKGMWQTSVQLLRTMHY